MNCSPAMSAEFPSYNSSVETLKAPFREDPKHRILYAQTASAMQKTGVQVKKQWMALIEGGFVSAMMSAELSLEPEPIVLELEEKEYAYNLTFEGAAVDSLLQPIDLFSLTKDEELSPDSVAVIQIATFRGKSQKYSRLVMLSIKDEDISASSQTFHFEEGNLVAVHQVTQPGCIFPELLPQDEKQAIKVKLGYSQENQEEVLTIACGIYYQNANQQHFYKNIGGNLVTTQNLRIEDPYNGDLEIFDLYTNGAIVTSGLNLPNAIENIGNFLPAGTF